MINIILGLGITILSYFISLKIYNKFRLSILNPVLVSTATIIFVLMVFDIPYSNYEEGGNIITYILGPIVVILAVPLYKSRDTLMKNALPVIAGIVAGIVTTIISVYILCMLFKFDIKIILSLLPKSVTSPMAVEASKALGGIPGLTVVSVIATGIIGAAVAPLVFKYGKINDETAKGIGIGTSSHGVGTAKAVEISEKAGAASGLSMGLTGVITVIVASLISKFLA